MKKRFQIIISQKKKRWITVNGKRFHYIWLRDNCLCPECRHPTSFQKINDISTFSSIPEPRSIEQTDDQLIITWKEEPIHKSVFPLSWLSTHSYDRNPAKSEAKTLWDQAWIEQNRPEYPNANECDRQVWSEQLLDFGFTVLRNMVFEDLESFLLDIGPIYSTEYGTFAAAKNKPGANDLGETNYPLTPHTDYPNRFNPPLMVCFYMVENTTDGGDSILVDGFRVAKDFQADYPQYFDILSKTPLQFQQFYQDFQYFYQRSQPVLEVDDLGEITAINFGHSHAANWNVPFDEMEQVYQAYSKFFQYLKHPRYQYHLRLQSQDCLLMNNSRILHGRTGFDPNSGMRHLEVAYMPWDYFTGKQNFKKFKHLYIKNETEINHQEI